MASVDISAHSSPRCPQHTWYIREHPCPVLQPGTPAGHSRDWRPLTFTSCLRSHLFLFPLKLSVHVCVCVDTCTVARWTSEDNCGSWFFPSINGFRRADSGCQPWWQHFYPLSHLASLPPVSLGKNTSPWPLPLSAYETPDYRPYQCHRPCLP